MSDPRLKLCISAAAVLVGALLCTRFYLQSIEAFTMGNEAWTKRRIRMAVEQLPSIASSKDRLVLFVGASDLESSIDPIDLDGRLREKGLNVTSYNLAVRNITLVFDVWCDRLIEDFRRAGRVADAIVVKFSPTRATTRTTKSVRKESVLDMTGLFMSSTMLANELQRDPENGLRLFVYKSIYGGHSPSSGLANTQTLLYFSPPWRDVLPSWKARPPEVRDILFALWHNPKLHRGPAWDPETRGSFFWGSPESDAELAKVEDYLTDPGHFEEMIQWNRRTFDAVDLRFDRDVVIAFSRSLANLRRIAKRVILLHFPEDPRFYRPAATDKRVNALLQRMAVGAGATFINYTDDEMKKSEYLDPLHLGRAGRRNLNARLAEDLFALLQPNPPK